MSETCLRDEELSDFLEGRLTDEDRARAEKHLSECDLCLEEMVAVRGVVRGAHSGDLAPVPPELTEKAVRSVQRIEEDAALKKSGDWIRDMIAKGRESLAALMRWETLDMLPVRSSRRRISDDLVMIRKSFPGLIVEMEMEKTGKDRIRIWIHVVKQAEPATTMRVSLFCQEREISSQPLNVSGAVFDEIPFNAYKLLFSRAGKAVGEYSFGIQENGYARK